MRLLLSSTANKNTSVLPIPTTEADIRSTHNYFVDEINAARQGQGHNSSANAIIVLTDYKKRLGPFNTGKKIHLNSGVWQRRKVFFFLFSLLPLNICVYQQHLSLLRSFFSAAGDLIREARSRLSSDNVDMLLFL